MFAMEPWIDRSQTYYTDDLGGSSIQATRCTWSTLRQGLIEDWNDVANWHSHIDRINNVHTRICTPLLCVEMHDDIVYAHWVPDILY